MSGDYLARSIGPVGFLAREVLNEIPRLTASCLDIAKHTAVAGRFYWAADALTTSASFSRLLKKSLAGWNWHDSLEIDSGESDARD
jgi:hypothetical protein